MCGICGILNFDRGPIDVSLLKEMNNSMIHRGPDGEGIFLGEGIGLGHRRLSIIDIEGGKQPMGNEDGTIQVVFNGEIYNFLELKRTLEARGYRFRTRSDTETIIYSYMEWGEDFVQRLRGMFAIALWDERTGKLLLIRDRLGKKPLYYYLGRDCVLFASELKALLKKREVSKEIDPRALDAFLSFGYVPSPMSIFKTVRKLPPAYMAICREGEFSVRQYWHLDMDHDDTAVSENEACTTLKSLFDEAVQLRLISDVPLGAFLSGGVDSSAVVASVAARNGSGPVKTVAIGFSDKRFDELLYARIVANRYRTDHTEFVVEPVALDVIGKIVWHLDEPFADSSAIPTYYVSKMARQKVTVALSGDGGDETFAGYVNRYRMNRIENAIRSKLPPHARHILRNVGSVYPRMDYLPRPFRLKGFLNNLSRSFEEAYFNDMSFYFSPEMKRSLYRPEFAETVADFECSHILGRHFMKNKNPDCTTRVQYVDINTYLPEDILVKVDRMSMAHSLEVRAPILDHKLIEYAGRMPSSLKLRGNQSKYILKKAMRDRLPEEVIHRRKQGFSIPLSSWLRHELREFVHDTLFTGEARSRTFFEYHYVENLWKRHLGGKEDFASPIWALLMFELWQRTYLEPLAADS